MFRVTKEIHFCYGHRLLNYAGKCRNLHGHNGKAVITLEAASLDALRDGGGLLRNQACGGEVIDETLDHRMLLHEADPIIPELVRQGEPFVTLNANPTAENIARLIYERIAAQGLPVVEVTLWEAEASFAIYRAQAKRKRRW